MDIGYGNRYQIMGIGMDNGMVMHYTVYITYYIWLNRREAIL